MRVDVDQRLLSLASIDDPTYRYACAVPLPAGDGRDAEAWMRAVMEAGPPAWYRVVLLAGWRWVLRLRLEPSPDHVIGWPIQSVTPSSVVLAVGSPLLDARLVLTVDGAQVVHATVLHHRSCLGRVLWAAARPVHELTIPWLLRRASRPQARQ